MLWSSAVSDAPSLTDAIAECAARIVRELGCDRPDFVAAFVSPHHKLGFDRFPDLLSAALPTEFLLGCSSGGVIGGGREVEDRPGLSLTAAILPGVRAHPFRLAAEAAARRARSEPWPEHLAGSTARGDFLLLADPFSFDPEPLLQRLDQAFPDSTKVGGLASGGATAGANVLYLNGQIFRDGAVGLRLEGDIRVDTIVAQGCRPVGNPMFVTRCRHNVVQGLDGRLPRDVVMELLESIGEKDRRLLRQPLFLGLAMEPERQEHREGDFLVRNVLGFDRDSGFLAVGAVLAEQQVVQFHVRDARASHDELDTLLARYRSGLAGETPAGVLLFSCLGRGQRLYGRADHDSDLVRCHLGSVPLGGFFCNGEIGPVRKRTFLHGYTSAFALFRPQAPEPVALH